jgi:histidine triad (HIT) family protein
MSQDCIFCKIVEGEISSTKVYEDENVLAFMDINPWDKGHTLVIPKKHFDPITNVPDDILQKIIVVAKKIAAAQIKVLNAIGVNIAQSNGKAAGQEVPHVHFHIIPRYCEDCKQNWKPKKYESFNQMNDIANLIEGAIE